MKVKTSITLSEKLLCEIDRAVGEGGNRSAFIENVVDRYLSEIERTERDRRDAELLTGLLEDTEFESDVLDYSIDPMELGDDVQVLIDDRAEAG